MDVHVPTIDAIPDRILDIVGAFDHAFRHRKAGDEILEIKELPRSMIVIGAGVIGIEYATIFSALDTAVTVVEPRDTMLDFIDKEIVEDFTYQLRDRNMKLIFGQTVEGVEKVDGKCRVTLKNGRVLTAEMVLFAAGRVGAVDSWSGMDTLRLGGDQRGRPGGGTNCDNGRLFNIFSLSVTSPVITPGDLLTCLRGSGILPSAECPDCRAFDGFAEEPERRLNVRDDSVK